MLTGAITRSIVSMLRRRMHVPPRPPTHLLVPISRDGARWLRVAKIAVRRPEAENHRASDPAADIARGLREPQASERLVSACSDGG